MLFRKISLLLAIISLLSSFLHAQSHPYGPPFIKNYHYAQTGGSEQNWCITRDHRGVVYVGNNESGILEFDGSTWRTIPVHDSASVRSLITGEDGVVYAGLEGDFGRLEPGLNGSLSFRSLKDSEIERSYPDEIIWKTYCQDRKVFFCGMNAIFVFDPGSMELSAIPLPEHAFLSYVVNSELYNANYEHGLMKYQGDKFVPVSGGAFFREQNVFGLISMGPDQLLVGTAKNGLYVLDLEKGSIDSSFVNTGLKEDLKTSMLVNLSRDHKHIFVGTRDMGLIVLDTMGRMSELISTEEGLLDNTIAQVHIGSQDIGGQAVWLAHWMGISRVDLNSPFRMQSIGPRSVGMDGRGSGQKITDMVEFGGELYISTMAGILHRPKQSDRSWFRSMRGIREEIHDLQVVEPSAGRSFLLASGIDNTYIYDEDMRLSTLPVGGRKLLVDPDNPSIFYTGTYSIRGFQYGNGEWKEFMKVELNEEIKALCLDKFAHIWIARQRGLARLDLGQGQDMKPEGFNSEQGLPEEYELKLFQDPVNQRILVGSSKGFYRFDYMNNTFVRDSAYNSILPEGKNSIMTLHKGANDLIWFSFKNEFGGWKILGARITPGGLLIKYDRTFRAISPRAPSSVFYTDSKDQLWFSNSNLLFHFDQKLAKEDADSFEVLIRKVSLPGDSILFYGTNNIMNPSGQILAKGEQSEDAQPGLNYNYRDVEFSWSSPYFKNENQLRYSYFLEGLSSEWSDWSWLRTVKINHLNHGKYVMQVRARNAYGEVSAPAHFAFSILRPWYATVLAIFIYIFLLVSLVLVVIRYTRNLKSRAELLEKQNKEIELQKKELQNLNEEVTAQRDEIEAQRDSMSNQKELIDQQNRAMTDSIHYARRIQDAVLPAKEVMRYLLPKHFVFYRPRDIVSGDFFWVDKRDETVLIAVADCTGHGVPGAFMSMLGISLLNEISSKYSDHPTNEIMDELRDQVIAALGQTGDKYETRDGMEMSLVAINAKTREVQFSGANQDLYTFQKGELSVIKGDRMPVGIHTAGSTLFSAHSLKLNRGDTLYLFSDGYPDQFGGDQRKKFGSTRMKTLLSEVQQNIMLDQKEAIKREFESWKGKEEQIDDVLMIGIKL